jgi:hypothetical protein
MTRRELLTSLGFVGAASALAGPADGEPAPAAGRRSGQRPMTAKSSYNRLAYVRQD